MTIIPPSSLIGLPWTGVQPNGVQFLAYATPPDAINETTRPTTIEIRLSVARSTLASWVI
jgi:hypothetical protein